MDVIKQLKPSFQHKEEIKEVIDFEASNNWDYEIVLENLIRADYLAEFMRQVQFDYKKYVNLKIDYRWHGTNCNSLYLSIVFEKTKTYLSIQNKEDK